MMPFSRYQMSIVTLVAMLCLMPPQATLCGEKVGKIEYVGGLKWGEIVDAVPRDSLVYCLFSCGLRILDASHPESLKTLGEVGLPKPSGSEVALINKYALVANGKAGLQVVDISNPRKPFIVSSFKTSSPAWYVTANDSIAFVSTIDNLEVVDISDPSAPHLRGTLNWQYPMTAPWYSFRGNLLLRENRLYARVEGKNPLSGTYESMIEIVDVSDPSHPKESSLRKLSGSVTSIDIQDSLFFASSTDGLYFLSLSHPDSLPILTSYPTGDTALGAICVHGNYLCAATIESDFRVFDISNLRDVRLVGCDSLDSFEMPLRVSIVGEYAFVAIAGHEGGGDVRIIDVSSMSRPRMINQYEAEYVEAVAQVGSKYVAIAEFSSGDNSLVSLTDISDPRAPRQLGVVLLHQSIETMVGTGSQLLCLCDHVLVVIDCSDPVRPSVVFQLSVPTQTEPYTMAVSDSTVLLVTNGNSYRSELWAIRYRAPNHLAHIGTFMSGDPIDDVFILEGKIVLKIGDKLAALNQANWSKLSIAQKVGDLGEHSALSCSSSDLYVTKNTSGTEVFAFAGTEELHSVGWHGELDDGFTMKDSFDSLFFFKCFEDSTNIWRLSGAAPPKLIGVLDECILPQEGGVRLGNTLCILDWAGVLLYRIADGD